MAKEKSNLEYNKYKEERRKEEKESSLEELATDIKKLIDQR